MAAVEVAAAAGVEAQAEALQAAEPAEAGAKAEARAAEEQAGDQAEARPQTAVKQLLRQSSPNTYQY